MARESKGRRGKGRRSVVRQATAWGEGDETGVDGGPWYATGMSRCIVYQQRGCLTASRRAIPRREDIRRRGDGDEQQLGKGICDCDVDHMKAIKTVPRAADFDVHLGELCARDQ